MGGYGDLYHTTTTPPPIGQSTVPIYIIMRGVGIKHNRYANCSVALVGEIVIALLGLVLFKSHGILSRTRQLTIPSVTFLSFRKCAC